ncbi:hypothetical protein UFOVP607_26 [uncultured Caudovirales phage]|uniref:DUF7167 domain-containing protein n=1 Tax=uncultured Caudovirales phage TaxID=2100421 RepID=A0A6J5N5Q3_9CAUD|nr:hypothetical protein UFOVP607_26 [uncultured Caudovirales phage]
MSNITIKAWLNSGANINSKREIEFEVDLDDWNSMDDDEKEEFARDYAFEQSDWGWEVVGGEA